MGRKIPGKKHRHVVDPEKQRAKRLESLKNKVNNPPANPNDQEVPRSVLEIMEWKNPKLSKINQLGRKIRKKKKKNNGVLSVEQFLDKEEIHPKMKPEKVIPNLVQKPQESPENFLRRVSNMTQKIIKEQQFEDKFKVSIKKDPKTGVVLKVEKDKNSRKMKKSQKKTLSQKRKEKKLNKAVENSCRDFSELKDNVEFGEVVHRPPVNLKLGKKDTVSTSKKSDKYKNLLLKEIISNDQCNKKLELEKKEKERQFIVNAYRERKKLKKISL
ncbi:UNVERIFIED_CONTAM: hypothetical protein PYX00_000272 [Menopon gallinae]|uniref:Coiled-coil domain-containing protein 137 n=1 Tax=Menopon gallinae TaxID=328185 RepID=A0AAW2I7V3_9NEOP